MALQQKSLKAFFHAPLQLITISSLLPVSTILGQRLSAPVLRYHHCQHHHHYHSHYQQQTVIFSFFLYIDLSSVMELTTSSAPARKLLKPIEAHKHPHHVKVAICLRRYCVITFYKLILVASSVSP